MWKSVGYRVYTWGNIRQAKTRTKTVREGKTQLEAAQGKVLRMPTLEVGVQGTLPLINKILKLSSLSTSLCSWSKETSKTSLIKSKSKITKDPRQMLVLSLKIKELISLTTYKQINSKLNRSRFSNTHLNLISYSRTESLIKRSCRN